MAKQFTLPDGRNLEYRISGAPDGLPLVWFHGTPGACTQMPSLVAACEAKNVTLISPSRGGYGNSTRNKGRTVVDHVADTQALLEHLGHQRCVVGGWSGGGPHALACAARLPGCAAALVIAGVGPHDGQGLDFLAGQGQDNIDEYGAAYKGEPDLQAFCKAARAEMLGATVPEIVEVLSSVLPQTDVKALQESDEMGQYMVASFAEAMKHSCDGWVDDDISFITPWGFDVADVKCPIFLYQGSEDKMVPYSHGLWLASHLPQQYVTKHLEEGQGHISIVLGRIEGMLDELKAVAA